MTDTVTTQVLNNGPRNYVVRLLSQSDGTGESAVTKVDISTLVGPDGKNAPTTLAIEKAEWSIQGMSAVRLLFDATTDDEAMNLTGNGYADFHGSNINDPKSTGTTGDIKVTTVGAISGGTYDITLHLKKKQ